MTEGIIMPPTGFTVPAQRTPEHSKEWALVEAAAAGDTVAFDQLYRTHLDMVRRFVHARVQPGPVAEDIVSTVWLKAWKGCGRIVDQGVPFAAWLQTVARNAVYDLYKSAHNRLIIAVGDVYELETAGRPELDHEGAAGGVLREERAAAVRAALLRLTDDQCQVLTLRYFRDLSVTETAQLMDKQPGAIKALTLRASRRLANDPALLALFPAAVAS